MKFDYIAIVVGYGSIGKKHARIIHKLVSDVIIIDESEEMRNQAMNDYPHSAVLVNLEELKKNPTLKWDRTCAIIATWGPSHSTIFNWLADHGVKKILCEKPMAASVNKAHQMKERARCDGIALTVTHYIRYSNFSKAVDNFCNDHDLGEPELVIIRGGAACIATNGIHWIDLIIQIFGAEPNYVYSTAIDDKINPRSESLGFYGGSSVWSFPDGREAVIAFTNKSSIAAYCTIYYKNAIIEFGDDLSVNIYHRDRDSITKFPKITRTGHANELIYNGRLDGVLDFFGSLRNAHIDLLSNDNQFLCDASIGVTSVSAIIGALISGDLRSPIQLPINPESERGLKEYPIS